VSTPAKTALLTDIKARALESFGKGSEYIDVSADEIRALRDQVSLSQGQLATFCGVGPFVVREWEIGTRRPDNKSAFLLCALKDSLDQFS